MIILDTNVVSELLRPAPEPRVIAWLSAQDGADVWLTSIGEAELRFGAAIMPAGRRRDAIAAAIDALIAEDLRGRVLPFDSAAAVAHAAIAAARRAAGRPISLPDCQIAAICRARGASVATRNARDFEGCGVAVIDPWRA